MWGKVIYDCNSSYSPESLGRRQKNGGEIHVLREIEQKGYRNVKFIKMSSGINSEAV